MKLYLCDECGIDPASVVGIFDMDTATVAPACREYLRMGERAGAVVLTTGEIPVSFVVTSSTEGEKIYLTRNAPKVLARRLKTLGLK